MIVDKYVDHLPVHRQLQCYERMDVHIAQSTSNDWFRAALNHLSSLYEAHKRQTLATGYLGAGETPIKVLDEDKKGTSHRGFYWVYRNVEQKLVLFDYRPGRGREGPDDILQGFQGYLQTDGYSVYDDFGKRPGIVLLHCMAHARRKFFDAQQTDKVLAEHALELFGQLYAIERRINDSGLSGEAVVAMRQQEAVPVRVHSMRGCRRNIRKSSSKRARSPRLWLTACPDGINSASIPQTLDCRSIIIPLKTPYGQLQ